MSETAEEWINRHKQVYDVIVLEFESDVAVVVFDADIRPLAGLYGNVLYGELLINLETAEDCESLCRLLRVTPEPRNENL